jgi:sugar lactone lactonase YvrE
MKRILHLVILVMPIGFLFSSCLKSTIGSLGSGNNNNNNSSDSNAFGAIFASAPGTVSTFAGNGYQGYVDGGATVAEFANPIALAIDKQDNIYVVDNQNYAIRKISPSGVVTTLAGNGNPGYVDGPGANAEFQSPMAVAVDQQGNVYVSEGSSRNDQRIRKITPTGKVSTYAGAGSKGFLDGPALSAEFYNPGAVAVAPNANLYVGDINNFRIRELMTANNPLMVSTFAGNGTQGNIDGAAASAEFNLLSGLAFDGSGNLFVADEFNYSIRKITPSGKVSTFAGDVNNPGFSNGTGTNAQFVNPVAVAFDAKGNLYVSEGAINNCVRMISSAGVVTSVAGNQSQGYTDGPLAKAFFDAPNGLAVDSKGNIYVADTYNYVIRRITPN